MSVPSNIIPNSQIKNNKKELNTDVCYNTDEPLKHYAKSKQSDAKDHILYDFIYMKCPEQANL